MTTAEVVYLWFTVGAFLFFGIGLAGAVAYSKGSPQPSAPVAQKPAHT